MNTNKLIENLQKYYKDDQELNKHLNLSLQDYKNIPQEKYLEFVNTLKKHFQIYQKEVDLAEEIYNNTIKESLDVYRKSKLWEDYRLFTEKNFHNMWRNKKHKENWNKHFTKPPRNEEQKQKLYIKWLNTRDTKIFSKDEENDAYMKYAYGENYKDQSNSLEISSKLYYEEKSKIDESFDNLINKAQKSYNEIINPLKEEYEKINNQALKIKSEYLQPHLSSLKEIIEILMNNYKETKEIVNTPIPIGYPKDTTWNHTSCFIILTKIGNTIIRKILHKSGHIENVK